MLVILALGAGVVGFTVMTGTNPVLFFPPLLPYTALTWTNFLISCAMLALLFGDAILLFNHEPVG